MKRKILSVITLTLSVGIFMTLINCNSGSGNKAEFDQKAFNEQIQGVFEYLRPNQGLSINFDNHFIFVYGDSDTSMVCQAGTCTVSRDTVIFTAQYASNPELVGTSIRWSARFMNNDSIQCFIFDDSGNITMEFYSKRLVNVDENIVTQMKKFEGSYNYVSGYGGGIILSGYMVYITQSNGGAGTYEEINDTVTFKRLFSTDPELIGAETTWVNESRTGDTLNWAVVNKTGEVRSRGKSLYSR